MASQHLRPVKIQLKVKRSHVGHVGVSIPQRTKSNNTSSNIENINTGSLICVISGPNKNNNLINVKLKPDFI